MNTHFSLFKPALLAGCISLAACSGGGGGKDDPDTIDGTGFKVSVSAPAELPITPVASRDLASLLSGFFISEATAVDVSNEVGEGNFQVAIIDETGTVLEIVEPVSIDQEADGSWIVTLEGGVRIDCVIIADLSGTPGLAVGDSLPSDAIYAPTASEQFDIDVRSTAAYQELLEEVENAGQTLAASGFTPEEVDAFIDNIQQLPLPDYTPGQTLEQYLAASLAEIEDEIEREIFVVQNTDDSFSLAGYMDNGGPINWFESYGMDFERGVITYINGSTTETEDVYNVSTDMWDPISVPAEIDGLILSAGGDWTATSDLIEVDTLNSDGSVTIQDTGAPALKETLTGSSIKVTGQNIELFIPEWANVLHADTVFSDVDANAIQLGFTAPNDIYLIDAEDNGAGGIDTYPPISSANSTFATLDNMFSTAAAPSGAAAGSMTLVIPDDSLGFELIRPNASETDGAVNVFEVDTSNPSAISIVDLITTATWERRTVEGKDIVLVDLQGTVIADAIFQEDGELFYYFLLTVYDNAGTTEVVQGVHIPAGAIIESNEFVFNDAAAAEINAAFDIDLEGLDCSYLSGWDDQANNGNGEPLVFNSYTDYLEVVSRCGGANSTVKADMDGTTWEVTYTEGGTDFLGTIVFNADGTFNFTEVDVPGGNVTDSDTGTWSVSSNLVTLTNAAPDFVEVWAITAAGTKGYLEEDDGWSSNPDLSTLDNSKEGEIFDVEFVKQ